MSLDSLRWPAALVVVAFVNGAASVGAQTLDDQLKQTPAAELAAVAKMQGDATRGAVVFFQHYMACSKCHSVGGTNPSSLGPDLTKLGDDVSDEKLVEAVLLPSKSIRKGYETVTVTTVDGTTLTGLFISQDAEQLTLRDASRGGKATKLKTAEIDETARPKLSIMPAGQVNQLAGRQQFYDLIRYLIEIRDGGAARARALQPSPALTAFALPEYEQRIDHRGLIGDWNRESLRRGEAVYQRVCANCHGTKDRLGSLPTSLRFAEGKFKNGCDPFTMYQTLTRGFGLMAPQTWMVPSQKYDVIHYIREAYLKPYNASQYVTVDDAYLARLPKGYTRGPEPSKIEPWSAMDYGPNLAHTYQVPGERLNIAYKGVAVRLDPGAGGVSRGRHWMLYDTDTLRVAAAWSSTGNGDNFIDWRSIQLNGEHQIHPHLVGRIEYANSVGPGWGDRSGSFVDDRRVAGRDGRRYGPLPRDWGRFRGLYHHGQQVVLSYSLGAIDVLESPRVLSRDDSPRGPLFSRTFNIGPRERDLVLQVAEHPTSESQAMVAAVGDQSVVIFGPARRASETAVDRSAQTIAFDGATHVEVADARDFELTAEDFTIVARMKSTVGGTIFANAAPGEKWTPNGQTFFVRDGRLGFDIGWVGAVNGKTKLNDGQWHDVAATRRQSDGRVRLYVDGRLDGEGRLTAKGPLPSGVVRIGYTAPNFPRSQSYFEGEIDEVRFVQRDLSTDTKRIAPVAESDASLVARWRFKDQKGATVADASGRKHDGAVIRGGDSEPAAAPPLVAGFTPTDVAARWTSADGRLRLRIPAGNEPLRFTVWTMAELPEVDAGQTKWEIGDVGDLIPTPDADLAALTHGGPARWPQKIETAAVIGADDGPFAADVLTAPAANPWLAQTRFTGLDFFADGRLAVCSWDGDVWTVEFDAATNKLTWRRIASGMFQPLGLKIVDDKINVICRDQLSVLHDVNGDGEIDFYECLNNDHQVTEHFHEFAMGLQIDAAGNFYYAKSGRHGLGAVVPHHGTLLRISRDGSQTDVVATGFRAANGVCLNPDGSFVVTDQEGFWNPKNRINWVTHEPFGKPKFYGNLYGYTDVTDSSDAAMEPPLCWITNAFDRSPAELLWVDSKRWGPLDGGLLNLSYGNGKVFLVPHERVHGAVQGGMIELPIPAFPTGVMRGRFSPRDDQLYLCGMFAWAGSATHPGGLYRLRATGRPTYLPICLRATKSGIELTFTDPLDPSAVAAQNVAVKTWSLKRTAEYGSKHYDEQSLAVRGARLSADGKTVTLDIPEIRPTWCMEIKYEFQSTDGTPVPGLIHNTIHALAE